MSTKMFKLELDLHVFLQNPIPFMTTDSCTYFCTLSYFSCLAHLACVTRQQSLHIGVRKLKIVCPTCRQPQPALPYLKRKVSTNFTLQEIVQSWLLQHEMVRESPAYFHFNQFRIFR